jgi:hypothetical protein
MTLTGMHKCTSAGRVDMKWLSVVVKKTGTQSRYLYYCAGDVSYWSGI